MNPDELELHELHERCSRQWESGLMPHREDIARVLYLIPRVFAETIRLRQQLATARAEAGTPHLLLLPTQTR